MARSRGANRIVVAAARAALAATLFAALAGAGLGPGSALAVSIPWTVMASPMTLTEGQTTNVNLTVTAGTTPIGTVTVTIPAGFKVWGAVVTSMPPAHDWAASVRAGSPTVVTFNTMKDSTRLQNGEVGVFTVRVTPTTTPLGAWVVRAYQKFTNKSATAGLPVPPLQAFVIQPAPTPVPTVRPDPTATPDRTTPPDPTPDQTRPPTPAPTPGPTPTPTTPLAVVVPATPDPGASPRAGLQIPTIEAEAAVAIGDLASVDSIGLFAWMVPGFFLGLPGVLIILIVLAQLGGFLLLPFARRWLGAFGVARRRRREEPA